MLGSFKFTTQAFQVQRLFSTTCFRCGHYDTLGVSKTASKAAIKASYYKVSGLVRSGIEKAEDGDIHLFEIAQ